MKEFLHVIRVILRKTSYTEAARIVNTKYVAAIDETKALDKRRGVFLLGKRKRAIKMTQTKDFVLCDFVNRVKATPEIYDKTD